MPLCKVQKTFLIFIADKGKFISIQNLTKSINSHDQGIHRVFLRVGFR